MVGVMYPLESIASVRMTRNHSAVIARPAAVPRAASTTTRRRTSIEEQYAHYPTETVERIRNQVSLSALKALIVHMGSLKEGRKALILVSEGYTNMLPPQMRNADAQHARARQSRTRGNPIAGAERHQRGSRRVFAGLDMESDLREIYDTANRNNVAIYAVDPRGLPRLRVRHQRRHRPADRLASTSTRRWTRCGCWPRTPTAAPSSTATISPRA